MNTTRPALNTSSTEAEKENAYGAGACFAPSPMPKWLGVSYSIVYGLFFSFVAVLSYRRARRRRRYRKYSCGKKVCVWLTEMWYKRTTYLPVITHLIDQASDFTVMAQFYLLMQMEAKAQFGYGEYCRGLDMRWMFALCAFIFIEYRIVSAAFLFYYTRSVPQLFSQLMDFELFHAISLNWRHGKLKPNSIQLYIQSLEATFESAPQALLQFIFLIETESLSLKNGSAMVVLVGFLFSLWSIMWKIVVEDKQMFPIYARKHHFNPNHCCRMQVADARREIRYCCFLSFPYCLRIVFRIADVTLRIFTCGLLYAVWGSSSLLTLFCLELLILATLSWRVQNWSLLGSLISVRMSTDVSSIFLFFFRAVVNLGVMVCITAATGSKRRAVLSDSVALALFLYCWPMCVLFPCIYVYIDREMTALPSKESQSSSSWKKSTERNLHAMIGEGKEVPIRDALAFGWYVHGRGTDGRLPIHVAAHCGELRILRLLIKYGAAVNCGDSGLQMPLHLAARFGHYKCCKLLVKHNSDVNARDKLGRTPLLSALLFAASADHSATQKKVKRKRRKGHKHKRKHKGHKSGKGKKGHCEEQQINVALKIVKFLIGKGAFVDVRDSELRTALHYAAEGGDAQICDLLLKDRAKKDVNSQDSDGFRPLHVACANGRRQIAALLLKNGAELSAATKKDGATALHLACESGSCQLTLTLLRADASALNTADAKGNTPLHIACRFAFIDLIEVLLQNCADKTLKDNCGRLCYELAPADSRAAVEQMLHTTESPPLPEAVGGTLKHWVPKKPIKIALPQMRRSPRGYSAVSGDSPRLKPLSVHTPVGQRSSKQSSHIYRFYE